MKLAAIHGVLRSLALLGDVLRGGPARRRAPDRVLLERAILPAYAGRSDVRRLLFVGCARYTAHYATYFDDIEYWTLDALGRNRRWGGRRHIVDRLERLDRHVGPDHFDAILCNGVLGWGLDRREDVERAFGACHRALRAGGELVLGWNDVVPRNGVRPDSVEALKRYVRCAMPGVGGPVLRVDGPHRHVFEFYCKPARSQPVSVVGASGAGTHAESGLHVPATQSS